MKTILRRPAGCSFLALGLLLAFQFASVPKAFGKIGCRDGVAPDEDCPGCAPAPVDQAMAVWRISEPAMDLVLTDAPVGYRSSRGLPVAFGLAYRQRGVVWEGPAIFGVGTNWTTSFRTYVMDATSFQSGLFRLHRGGAKMIDYYVDYYLGTPQFYDGSLLTTPDGGQTYQIEYADGAKDVFGKAFTNGAGLVLYFLTAQRDPASNSIAYVYSSNQNIVRLLSVTDPDNRSTQLYYENSSFTNQITKVVDPFSRTNLLQYDAAGYLTNIVDVAGLASSFRYDAGSRRGWITNLITPYGTTSFRFGGVDADSAGFYSGSNQVNRSVEIALPSGGKHLYLYRQDGSSILSTSNSAVPSTSPFANTLDNVDHHKRNSFHWGPIQYVGLSTNYLLTGNVANLTSNDYRLGRLRHWLVDPATGEVSDVLSLERAPSQDGTTLGQFTWFDYPGKSSGASSNGTTALPLFEARVLPDGSSWFERASRNSRGTVTNFVSTSSAPDGSIALRTNVFVYATNEIDLVRHTGPQGEQVVSNYFNAYHQPLASYNALNEATLYTYNGNRQVIKRVSPGGLTTTNVYFTSGDDANRLQKTIDLEINRTNSYTYYANGLVLSHTDERGLTTTNYWDNLQRLTGRKYPDGTTTSNIYTALDVTATKDRLGFWSYTGYNSVRQKIAETNANNVVTRYDYCDCGALLFVTNAWNTAVEQVTGYNYDLQGNRTYVYLPDDTITNWYNPLGQLTMTADGWAYRAFIYNQQGLQTAVTNAYGAEQITVFDIEDRPIYVTDANRVSITNTYDVLGRLSTRTYPDGGVERFGYSARGLTAYTNQLDKITYYGYDEARRKIAETNANNEITRYTNNAAGDLLSLTDGKNQTTKWNYDEYGRVTNKLDQAGTEILRYKYDPDSRLTNRWSAAKGDTKYKYDPVGNLTNVDYAVSTDVKFQYDPLNRVTNMVDASGTTKYAYTAGGFLWTEDGPFSNDTVTNVYSNRLRTGLRLAQPTGMWTNGFWYDYAKRLTNVTSPAGSFAYTLGGTSSGSPLPKKILLPNTAYITNTYDNVARLTSTSLKNSSHTTLNSHQYAYNPGNQCTQQVFSAASTYNYTYDPIGQLKVADSATASEDRGYTYDAAWNLNWRTNNGIATLFEVDIKNQLTNSSYPPGEYFYQYDNNGNLTYSDEGLLAYFYDDENRLSIWEFDASGGHGGDPTSVEDRRTQFIYDGLGRLRRSLEYVGAFDEGAQIWYWLLTSETRYIYDGRRVIQERNSSNTPTVSYTRGSDLSGSLEGAGGIGGLLGRSHGYSSGNWSTHNFYHADGNGNVTYLVNGSQTLAATYRYDPFGNTISSSGSLASANVYRFSSKEIHVNSGFYYYGYRWYAPNLQRWLNRDPKREEGFRELRNAGLRGGTMKVDRSRRAGSKQNFDPLYIFVFNSPIKRIDPKGLDSPGCDGFPNASACQLECCARHDECFDDNDCSAWSWLNPLPCLTPCGRCNLEVVDCFLQCLDGYSDNPDRPNYYCAQCHEYFDLDNPTDINFPEDNPHFGHHTYGFPDP